MSRRDDYRVETRRQFRERERNRRRDNRRVTASERGQRRARTNLRMSNDALAELYVSVGGEWGFPKEMTLDRLIPFLERVRRLLLVSSTKQPDDLLTAHRPAFVEYRLAERLLQARRREDSLAVLLESQAKLKVLVRRFPVNEMLRDAQMMQFRLLAQLSEGMGKIEDSVNYLTQGIQTNEEEIRLTGNACGFTKLATEKSDNATAASRESEFALEVMAHLTACASHLNRAGNMEGAALIA